jgi:tetratricopeptide (TPR) repeat protein
MHYSIGRNHERAWRYGRIAGDRARETYANEEAALQYERALEAARRLEACPERDLRRVWTYLGDVREQAGRFDGALDAYRKASALVGTDTVAKAELLLRRASTRERAGAYSSALREATRARHLVGPAENPEAAQHRARAWAFTAFVRQRQERPHHALAAAVAAIDEARSCGERAALARSLSVTAWAHLMLDKPGAESLFRQALESYEELDDLIGQADITNNLGGLAYFEGRWDEALEYYERSRSATARLGNIADVGLVEANIGEVLVNQGRLDEAEPVLRSASHGLRASGYVFGATFAEMQLGRLLTARGDLAGAERLLTQLLEQVRDLGYSRDAFEVALYLADCLVQEGQAVDALALLDEAGGEAGDEASIFAPTEARVRAAALIRLSRHDDASAHVRRGLEIAQQRSLEYDAALLLELEAKLQERRQPTVAHAAHKAAQDICDRLGVRRPQPLDV